ncbi:Hypothetical protein LUCI_1572 [Lucifera butyrica]|uniref:Uncharacterized protein n=1 Tax=Lucifera butyrica TaxID=1351585 RepID=A0A498R4I1_9FIRM|nr:DUF2680 domain-containing protein [Lucifera butyrica]VBB06341.1 Hypothetical protein LUCI_1572 [Lucifera butyrica]
MKKTAFLIVAALLVLAFAGSIVSAAATSFNRPAAYNYPQFTEQQKQELAPLYKQMNDLQRQMFELQKQLMQKQVAFGYLTQSQADQWTNWMQERLDNGYGYGPGMMGYSGGGTFCGGPGYGPGYGRGYGPGMMWRGQDADGQ